MINEGDEISIDGSTGEVFLGAMPVVPSPVETYIESGLAAALDGADDETTALVTAVDRLLTHADGRRRLAIRANADTAEDAVRARSLGAQGIGLCRTEHMFLGDRRSLIERVILAGTTDERDAALDALLPLQRKDFTELLEAMDGLPVNIRLLDPPLHEFLPDRTELAVKVAVAEASGETGAEVDADRKLLAAVEKLHESNPMLGLRGVRLGLLTPGLFALQVRAIAEAASDQIAGGQAPEGRDHGPAGRFGDGAAPGARRSRGRSSPTLPPSRASTLTVPIGTMIELPRAALTAHRIADAADFFSFGTNDLTQTTWGFSRDDVESSVFAAYLEKGVFTVSPFETIDADGVGRLVRNRRRGGPEDQAGPQARGLRRARRRPGIHPLLPQDRAGLRVLLAVPGTGRPARSRPSRRQLEGLGRESTCNNADPGCRSASRS